MSDTRSPGGPPPDHAPQDAEAYRRGYQGADPERGRSWTDDPAGRSARLVAVAMVSLLLALVVGAYGAGRLIASTVDGAGGVLAEPAGGGAGGPVGPVGPVDNEDRPRTGDGREGTSGSNGGRPGPRGPVEAVAVGTATASCQAPSSVDAAGNPVGYPPGNAIDQDRTTAWRCSGDGVGESITLTVPRGTRVGLVGLVAGYAKTDPRTGTDRYAQNRRLTRVRWTFDDGTSYTQRLDGSPTTRRLQTRTVPTTPTRRVRLEILASTPGDRDTVAVSDIRIGRVAG